MKFFIDFEATQENEIISIGCVSEKGTTFKSLVKPQFSSISPYISQLTKITNEMVNEANSLDYVFSRLYEWIKAQSPYLINCEFYAYGTDEDFIKASFSNLQSENAFILASVMIANMKDFSKEAHKFFHGSIKLIHAFNYVENLERKQNHDPLEDALMLQKVYEHVSINEPLSEHPLHTDKQPVEYKSPSGVFYCKGMGKNAQEREFKTCEEAIDWVINNIIRAKEPEKIHRERIMAKIMHAIRHGSMYCNYKWRRVK